MKNITETCTTIAHSEIWAQRFLAERQASFPSHPSGRVWYYSILQQSFSIRGLLLSSLLATWDLISSPKEAPLAHEVMDESPGPGRLTEMSWEWHNQSKSPNCESDEQFRASDCSEHRSLSYSPQLPDTWGGGLLMALGHGALPRHLNSLRLTSKTRIDYCLQNIMESQPPSTQEEDFPVSPGQKSQDLSRLSLLGLWQDSQQLKMGLAAWRISELTSKLSMKSPKRHFRT